MDLMQIAGAAITSLDSLSESVLERIFDIIKAPVRQPEMLWIIVPVLVSTILMTYYFGKYKKEELGWNTAFGNSIILFFACIDLLRYLFTNQLLGINVKTILVVAVLLEGIILTFLNFLHALPKSFAFGISSGMTVNILALSLIVLIYSQLPLDQITAIAIVIISVVVLVGLRILQALQWGEDEEEES